MNITKVNPPLNPVVRIAGFGLSGRLVLPCKVQLMFDSLDDPALTAGE